MKNLFGETPLRLLAFGGLLVILFLAFLAVQILLVPFVAALFVVYLFEPPIVVLQRRGMDRGKAFLILLAITFVGIVLILGLMPQWLRLEAVSGSSATFADRLSQQLGELEHWVDMKLPMLQSIRIGEQVTNKATDIGRRFFEQLPVLLTSFLVNLLLVPFIAYFMIRDGKTLKRRIVELVPNRYFEMSLIVFNRIDDQIGGYLRGRLIECILVGVTQALCMGIASIFVDQRYILLIAGVCGITNMIPYLGPVMGTVFGAFLYLGSGLPVNSIFGLIAASAGAHVMDNIFIAPAVLSHNVDLHPLTVALVLVIGGELLGTLGLLIAIPVASSIKVIAQELYANYQLQVRT
ncbi:MAG TPA: AI-2E family transporter [Terriglobia bacterium]|nr:AI-2E family transporter [Terriglobia bacterium]